MKSLVKYIQEKIYGYADNRHIYEMATIAKDVILNKERKSVQIHGTNSGDRETPHIHIYNYCDKNNFNFEISLVDLLCYDELILVRMLDRQNHKDIRNRSKCSWDGYSKMRNDFEDWLYSSDVKIPGEYIDNLDALIYWYNQESSIPDENNPLLKYISDRGKKLHKDYKKYFSEDDLNNYRV